jgi:hypothetical protein
MYRGLSLIALERKSEAEKVRCHDVSLIHALMRVAVIPTRIPLTTFIPASHEGSDYVISKS